MKILVWVISIFGIWTINFAQPGEGVQRIAKIESELNQILSKNECLAIKNRLTNILNKIGAANPNNANNVSIEFEEDMKNMVAKGELPRRCYQEIIKALDQKKLKAVPPEANPGKAPAPAAVAIGLPGEAKSANEPPEQDSTQSAKTQPDKPTTPKSPITGKVADEIKKGAGITEPTELGKVAEGIKKGANSNPFNRPETGYIPNVKRVTGTGNTTGHIATLTVSNTNDYPETVIPQIFYIPSDGKYQSYVGRIPDGISIPPGTTKEIEVMGNCANVNAPPVPDGDPMPPIDMWIPVVGEFQVATIKTPNDKTTPVFLITTPPVSRFDPKDIQNIIQSNGYTREDKTKPDLIMTWPGTDIPVGGSFDPVKDPRTYAPVVVAAIEAIEDAVELIQTSEEFTTPISNNIVKERESIIQQTFWIYCAGITGKPYVQEDFKGKVYEQVEQNMGKTVSSLPNDKKEEVDKGITDFWNTFQATGVEAKILMP